MPRFDAYFDDLKSCSLIDFLEHKLPTNKIKAYSLYKGTLRSIIRDVNIEEDRRVIARAWAFVLTSVSDLCREGTFLFDLRVHGRYASVLVWISYYFRQTSVFWNYGLRAEQSKSEAVKQYWKKRELEDEIYIEETLHVLDATIDTRKQGHLLRKIITEKLEKRSASQVEEETNFEQSQIKRTRTDRQVTPEDQIYPSFLLSENHMANTALYTQNNDIWEKLARQENQIEPQKALNKEQLSELDDDYNLIDHEIFLKVNNCCANDHEELRNLSFDNASIRIVLLDILFQYRSKDFEMGKTIMNSNFLNDIIDLTDASMKQCVRSSLNEGQRSFLNLILEKQTWDQTNEFKDFCSQFTEDNCDRVQVPTLNVPGCVGLELAVTKNRKIDGILKVLNVKKENHRVIGIAEFSKGIKSPNTKDVDDKVKLGRNAMRILNKLLDTVSSEKARVYTIQCVNGEIRIRYMVRPLPSIYLYDEFACIKLPNSFDHMEQFATEMAILMNFQKDILKTVKSVKKSTGDKSVYKSEVKPTPERAKKNNSKKNENSAS
ncbi:3831_t:CDS:10 [Ambispora leptoticha]|uniref:3831_t:CDS:1 n=1 Tax=Ambispora leptoticha TaxID=144679 RepID=A0A9N8ZWJ7_9GLOM|nr:3831_t:CDS:10 [Ambispora leptoticha]